MFSLIETGHRPSLLYLGYIWAFVIEIEIHNRSTYMHPVTSGIIPQYLLSCRILSIARDAGEAPANPEMPFLSHNYILVGGAMMMR